MIKISFSGIEGCGKTSLLSEVKKVLSLKYKVESIDKISQKSPFDEDKKSNFISRFYFLSTQINEENVKSIASPDILLCDGSVLDQWILWKKHTSQIEVSNQIKEKNNVLKNLYEYWIKTYDLTFFIKTSMIEYEKRKIENELIKIDTNYLIKTEEIYTKTIEEDNLNIIEIWNNSSIDEGAQKIIKFITDFHQD